MAENGENPTWRRWDKDASMAFDPLGQAVMALVADVLAEPSGAWNALAEYADDEGRPGLAGRAGRGHDTHPAGDASPSVFPAKAGTQD